MAEKLFMFKAKIYEKIVGFYCGHAVVRNVWADKTYMEKHWY